MENNDVITIEQIDKNVVYSQDKAQIDVQISTAKAYPRNVKRAVDNSIAIATMDKQTASTCNYSIPRGGKSITGASVHLALILAQNWGNLRIESKITSIDEKSITSQSVCFDLENNIAIKVEVRRSIMTKYGRMNDDMITVTGNAANSISLRNAILKVIPRAVVNKVYDSAKQMITGDLSDEAKLVFKRKQILDTFKDDYGVTEREVLDSIGKASVTNITSDDVLTLIGFGQSIKDGDSTVDFIFRPKKEVKVTKTDLKKAQSESKNKVDLP